MSIFNKYPYTDFHELNLDWLLEKIKELATTMEEFTSTNEIKYADPIAWDITSQYEANTVVINGTTSYLSKKPVPAGIDISNTDYWILVGDFETRTDELQDDLDALTLRVSGNEGNISNLQRRMTTAEGNISNLQRRMTTAEGNIDALTDRVNRRYVLIADSYGVGITHGGTTTGWTALFKSYMNLSDDDCYISQIGGSGFVGNVPSTFEVLLDAVNATNPNTITDVIVVGGFNDAGKSGLGAAVDSFCNKAKTKFPNATIRIGMAGYSSDSNGSVRSYRSSLEYFYSMSSFKNMSYMNNLSRILQSNPTYMSQDTIHPTSIGYVALAKAIVSSVCFGNVNAITNGTTTPTLTGANDVTVNITLTEHLENDIVQVYIPGNLRSFSIGATKPNAFAFFKLATLSNNICKGNTSSDAASPSNAVPFSGFARFTTSPQYKNINGAISINYNSLFIRIDTIENGTFLDLSNCDGISIASGVYNFNANLV